MKETASSRWNIAAIIKIFLYIDIKIRHSPAFKRASLHRDADFAFTPMDSVRLSSTGNTICEKHESNYTEDCHVLCDRDLNRHSCSK